MPGLELHTLNQVEADAIVRAGDGAAAARPAIRRAEKSPVITGDFSLPPLDEFLGLQVEAPTTLDSPALTTIPEFLPSLDSMGELFEQLQDCEMMGDLMYRARMSRLTGCFFRPEAARNHNGYSSVKSKAAKEIGLGTYREAHRVAHFMYKVIETGELPTDEELGKKVDHICRCTSCWNPAHTRLLSNQKNNELKRAAGKIEYIVISGQQFYIGDLLQKLPWLEHTLISNEDEYPVRAISTRAGPFALLVTSPEASIVYGHQLQCEAFDSLRPLGKNNYFAPSRAKPYKPVKNNSELFHKNKYKKKRRPTQQELYEAQMDRA
ncbi:MAG TPA: hypothetical protein VFJ84_03435 [Candidatus Saccharimonadales bacterium]|nr:hypothetical protein [Candidatus Saccharimonadales bacterium]